MIDLDEYDFFKKSKNEFIKNAESQIILNEAFNLGGDSNKLIIKKAEQEAIDWMLDPRNKAKINKLIHKELNQ